jgi:hypothetical protein
MNGETCRTSLYQISSNFSIGPSSPTAVQTFIQTSNSVSLNITKGIGNVEYFEIYVNSTKHGTVMASANSDWTQHVIYELEGGILYSIWVKAVKNERSSESSHILTTKTCKFILICTK